MSALYRCMRKENGFPAACGDSKWCLGVVICPDEYCDIDVGGDGLVHPATGGLSVSPDDPLYLPSHRRPKKFGGTSRHPLWALEHTALTAPVSYRPDLPHQDGPHSGMVTHGVVEPALAMAPDDYQGAL